ncbi:MAG: site-specific integrase [Candidatus Eremiobacteraeota bacterium]|nr:site-specific integrase [Candidatus Eremiobacteraeota bacterium]
MPSWKQQSEGSWTATVSLGRDPVTGKRRQERWTYKTRSKREAEAMFRREWVAREQGERRPGKGETFAEYAQLWLDRRIKKLGVGDTTDTYRSRIEQHLIPAFGARSINSITARMVDDVVSSWRDAPRLDRKKGPRSKKTVHDMYALLKQIFDGAVRDDVVATNPCRKIEPPPKGKPKPKGLRLDDAVQVMASLAETDLYAPVVVATMTGMRRSEILGLQWRDVNERERVLEVRRAVAERRDEGGRRVVFVKVLKTDGSQRDYPLGGLTAEVLREHGAAQVMQAKEFGWAVSGTTHIFANPDGRPLSPDSLSSAFVYAVKARELPKVSLKGLRTSFASALKKYGTDTIEIARLLGHTNDRTTRAHYLMEAPEEQRRAVERLDRQVRRRLPAVRTSSAEQRAAPRSAEAQSRTKVTKRVTKRSAKKKKPL